MTTTLVTNTCLKLLYSSHKWVYNKKLSLRGIILQLTSVVLSFAWLLLVVLVSVWACCPVVILHHCTQANYFKFCCLPIILRSLQHLNSDLRFWINKCASTIWSVSVQWPLTWFFSRFVLWVSYKRKLKLLSFDSRSVIFLLLALLKVRIFFNSLRNWDSCPLVKTLSLSKNTLYLSLPFRYETKLSDYIWTPHCEVNYFYYISRA